jgi:hypothetical protein
MFREITIEHTFVEAPRRANLGELLGWLHGVDIPMLEDICSADSMAPGFISLVTRSPFRRNWI